MLTEILNTLRPIFKCKAYLVGGCVRDSLKHIKHKDIDVLVTGCKTEDILNLGAEPVIAKTALPVMLLKIPGIGTIQIAHPRAGKDASIDKHGFAIDPHATLEDDLGKRDITINAMAIEIETGQLHDPFNGLRDLETMQLRHINEYFFLDPIRLFRIHRFCAKGYNIASPTRLLIRRHDWSKAFDERHIDRIYPEIRAAMTETHPERFFTELLETGAGKEILPEIFSMKDIPAGPKLHHPENSLLQHCAETLMKVAALTTDPTARLCAFLHDLGKTMTPPDNWPSHIGHENLGAELSTKMLKRLKAPTRLITAVSAVNALHMKAAKWQQLRPSSQIDLCLKAHKARIENFLPAIVQADSGIVMVNWEETLKIALTSAAKLGIGIAWMNTNRHRPDVIRAHITQKKCSLISKLPRAPQGNQQQPQERRQRQ